MITNVLIHDWCRECCENTDQELNTVALELECTECRNVDIVSEHFVRRSLEELEDN